MKSIISADIIAIKEFEELVNALFVQIKFSIFNLLKDEEMYKRLAISLIAVLV